MHKIPNNLISDFELRNSNFNSGASWRDTHCKSRSVEDFIWKNLAGSVLSIPSVRTCVHFPSDSRGCVTKVGVVA
jgi:hypothetical protein